MSALFHLTVSGWRHAQPDPHGAVVAAVLGEYREVHGDGVLLRHGQCKYGGVDLLADQVGRSFGWQVVAYPAEERDGRILGPARNATMLKAGTDELVAFPGPGSRGTLDCVRQAAELGIPFRGVPLASAPGATRLFRGHDCPGECGAQVAVHQFACRDCWSRLPGGLKQDVLRTYRHRHADPTSHRAAMVTATNWYRQHPTGGRRG